MNKGNSKTRDPKQKCWGDKRLHYNANEQSAIEVAFATGLWVSQHMKVVQGMKCLSDGSDMRNK